MITYKKYRLFGFGFTIVMLLMIVAFVWWNLWRTDKLMRQELLEQASLVALSLQEATIESLTATESDLEKPGYQILKKNLTAVIKSDPDSRFVYLMGRNNDGQVFFYLDNDEEEPATPGEIYDDASTELIEAFDKGKAFTEGPLPDQWGVWVSAIVPITDESGANVIAVLGIDSDATLWRHKVVVNSLGAILLSFFFVVGIGFTVFSLRLQVKQKNPRVSRLIIPLSITMTLIVSGMGYLLYSQQKKELVNSGNEIRHRVVVDVMEHIKQQMYFLDSLGDLILKRLESSVPVGNNVLGDTGSDISKHFSSMFKEHEVGLAAFAVDKNTPVYAFRPDKEKAWDALAENLYRKLKHANVFSGLCGDSTTGPYICVILPLYVNSGRANIVKNKPVPIGYLLIAQQFADVLHGLHLEHKCELAVVSVNGYPEVHGSLDVWDSTIDTIPREEVEKILHTTESKIIIYNDSDWQMLFAQLQNFTGVHMGDLVIMRNVTDNIRENNYLLLLVAVSGAVTLCGLLGLFYVMLNRIDKRLEDNTAKLRESEMRHKTFFSAAPDAYFVVDINYCLLSYNDKACELFHIGPEDAIGMHVGRFSAEFQAEGVTSLQKLNENHLELMTRGAYSFNWKLKHPQGKEFWGEINLVLMSLASAPDEKIIFGTIRDITERKEYEERINSANSLLNATLESTYDAILVDTLENKIILYNQKFVDMWGIPKSMLDAGDDDAVLRHMTAQVVDSKQFLSKLNDFGQIPNQKGFDILQCNDGRILERYTQPQTQFGEVVGRVWSFRDITTRIRAEQELVQAEKMAAVGALAAGVAHNFNNINTGLIGHLQMLLHKEKGMSENSAKKIRMLLDTVRRSSGLTRSLMSLAGRSYNKRNFEDVAVLLNDTIELLQTDFNAESIYVKRDIDISKPLFCNAGELCHVLLNLLSNAKHAFVGISRDSNVITVYCRECNGDCVISISDNGRGIPKEYFGKIFTPFFTAKGEHALPGSGMEKIKGAGLGLSSSRAIIQSLGGTLEFSSEEGIGSIFTITLPMDVRLSDKRAGSDMDRS